MPPKIKIVDVESDAYTITNDEVKESELPTENATSETTEETTAIIQEKDKGSAEEDSINTTASEPTKKTRNQELVQCPKCQKWVTPKTLKYTHSLKCGEVKNQDRRNLK